MKYYVGIDLGGTFIKAGVVDENCNIVAKASIPSAVDGDHEGLADRMVECAKMAEEIVGRELPGHLSKGGLLSKIRPQSWMQIQGS